MLGQIEWSVQNAPITKIVVLPVTTLFFEDFVTVQESLIKIWFDLLKTQMPILVLVVSAGVLFDCAFSLRVSLVCNNLCR